MAQHHNLGHFEIPAHRTDDLKSFYSSLFGWEFEKDQKRDYWLIENAGISGRLAPKENAEQMPTMFIAVEFITD
jgi:uncharacterized protein